MAGMSKLGAIRALHGDDAARTAIVKAIVAAKGSKTHAAEQLGVKKTTLYRVIEELKLWDQIDEACEKHGFRLRAGRERGKVTDKVRRKIKRGRRAVLVALLIGAAT